jgi:hypothetical protein
MERRGRLAFIAGQIGTGHAGAPSDTAEIARLRAENGRRDRPTAGLRRLCGFGQRTVVEVIIEFGSGTGEPGLLRSARRSLQHAAEFRFPCSLPLRGQRLFLKKFEELIRCGMGDEAENVIVALCGHEFPAGLIRVIGR